MALRRVLSNQLKLSMLGKGQTIRSGHGWDRPDVPTAIIPEYVHKREVSHFYEIKMRISESFKDQYD